MIYFGQCLCGAIRYQLSGAPNAVTLCHCSDCRRSAGAPVVVDRPLRAVWRSGRTPPAGAARDLLAVAAGGFRTTAAASPG